ncbi:MAG TPA: XrtA system polysaccharide chain length determinant [Steroidobacteraceae bacterium]|nr:XrtA system polysaccharide chain length determinant [Steroidobacteraceae bacterium]
MLNVVDQVLDELRGTWRFRWAGLVVAWIVSVIGWVIVYSMPDRYEAMARVYVDTRTPLRPLLTGVAADQDIEAQLIMVRQAMMGAPSLERVAREADLLVRATTVPQRQALVTGMAERIKIDLEPAASRDPRIPNTFYRITYQDHSREKAIKVVDLLLNAFVETTFGTKRSSAESAQVFLADQLRQYRERLAEAESALAEFKRQNIGMVPGEAGGFFQRLDQQQANVQRVEAQLRVALSRRAELQRQLRGESPYVAGAAGAGGVAAGQGPADTASRIQETQARLDDLLLRYTDRHPDVVAAKQTLEDLKARQQEELEAVRRGDAGAAAVAGASSNPVYQTIQTQLHDTEVQIAALRGELGDYQRNVAELRRALDTAPEVEAEFTRLTRDYDVTQTQYNNLLQRLEQARVSEDAQQTGIVDFQIVDPPSAPFSPVFPTRPLLVGVVLLLALAVGAGVAWLLCKMRPVFHHGRTLAEITGLPVIGVISLAWVERHRSMLRRDYLRYSVAGGLLGAATLLAAAIHEPGARIVQRLLG